MEDYNDGELDTGQDTVDEDNPDIGNAMKEIGDGIEKSGEAAKGALDLGKKGTSLYKQGGVKALGNSLKENGKQALVANVAKVKSSLLLAVKIGIPTLIVLAIIASILTIFFLVTSILIATLEEDEQGGDPMTGFCVPVNLNDSAMRFSNDMQIASSRYASTSFYPWLMAIMMVESRGGDLLRDGSQDVMQASESLLLPMNTLSYIESINQGARYLKEMYNMARRLGILLPNGDVDMQAVVQTYNFGPSYLERLAFMNAQNPGTGVHSLDTAELHSRMMAYRFSNGNPQRVNYNHPIAIENGRPWRWTPVGGNFHYVNRVMYYINCHDAPVLEGIRHGDFIKPMLSALVLNGFGSGYHGGWHNGIDLQQFRTGGGVYTGAPILAVADGVIIQAGRGGLAGNFVVIEHNIRGQIISTAYLHLNHISQGIVPGTQVQQGTVIGGQGNTGAEGTSMGHLHFEVHIGEFQWNRWAYRRDNSTNSVDPRSILPFPPRLSGW